MYLGIIADGNRRWAKSQGLRAADGHEAGFRVISDVVLPICQKFPKWKGLVVYAFSTENWKRDIFEINNLFALFERMCEEWKEKCEKENIKVVWAGRREKVPSSLRKKLEDLEEYTKENTSFSVFLCIDYGAHNEIERAIQKGGIDFAKYLEVPMLDYIIRTGGEQRLSGFCLWQAEYAELSFIPQYLPELSSEKMKYLLEEFEQRQRRKGK